MKKLLNNFEAYVCAVIFLGMTAVGFANVLVRYLTSYSFASTQELLLAGFLLLTVFGAALAAQRGQHLAVTFFTGLLPHHLERWVRLFAAAVSVGLLLLAAWFCIQLILNQVATGVTTAGLQLPVWYYSAALPVGFVLIALRTVQYAIHDFHDPQLEDISDV